VVHLRHREGEERPQKSFGFSGPDEHHLALHGQPLCFQVHLAGDFVEALAHEGFLLARQFVVGIRSNDVVFNHTYLLVAGATTVGHHHGRQGVLANNLCLLVVFERERGLHRALGLDPSLNVAFALHDVDEGRVRFRGRDVDCLGILIRQIMFHGEIGVGLSTFFVDCLVFVEFFSGVDKIRRLQTVQHGHAR
jgi:hypothetical protein